MDNSVYLFMYKALKTKQLHKSASHKNTSKTVIIGKKPTRKAIIKISKAIKLNKKLGEITEGGSIKVGFEFKLKRSRCFSLLYFLGQVDLEALISKAVSPL